MSGHVNLICAGRASAIFRGALTHFHAFYDEGRALPSLAKRNTVAQLWISRADAEARQLPNGDEIKIYNERGEFGAKAHVTDDVPAGVVWIRDGWVGLNHLTSGDAVLTGDALSLFPFSVGQSDYGARVEVATDLKGCSQDAKDRDVAFTSRVARPLLKQEETRTRSLLKVPWRSQFVQVFRRLDEDLSASADSRRLKSAKARNR